jgi:acetolactate synthase-1/2/3 large subunit
MSTTIYNWGASDLGDMDTDDHNQDQASTADRVRDRPPQRQFVDVDAAKQQWGSDFVADLLKAYGFEFVSFNPGASFRAIEESIVNYNDNTPEVIQTQNEELSVSIAHGHAKATGEPALCLLHDTVGTLNGAMGVYNAYVDRVPLLLLGGNGPRRKSKRRPWIDWIHTNLDQGALVREYTKWDDEPAHVDGVADSIVRAHNVANTRPKGPVYVTLDHELQEAELDEPVPMPELEAFPEPMRPAPDLGVIGRIADMLIEADRPVALVDAVGDSRRAVEALVDLAEDLALPVVDSYGPFPHRYNFPNTHPMNLTGTEVLQDADLVLALDARNPDLKLQTVDRATHERSDRIEGEFDLITIGMNDLEISSLTADYDALHETTLSVLADTDSAIPALHDAVQERLDADEDAERRVQKRFDELATEHNQRRRTWREAAEEAWDERPISVARLAGELWETIREDEWVMVAGTLSGWSHRLWEIDEFDRYVGGTSGGGGVGYGIGAAIGGALAYAGTDRIPINLQADGDLMQFLSGLWTIAHHDVPLFTVVHNNRCLYNSTRHRMDLAELRGRDASFERALIGTSLTDPTPEYAAVAEALGVSGYGPIEEPDDLGPTLRAAWDEAKTGNAVLVDVVSQPR